MQLGIGLDVLCPMLGIEPGAIEAALLVRKDYRQVRIPKKSGGYRKCFAPPPALRLVQDKLRPMFDQHYAYELRRHRLLRIVHGSVSDRSPLTNALAHKDSKAFYLCDLHNAFGQVTEDRLTAIFDELPFSSWVRDALVSIVSWRGALPQGAPTSPVLFNLACREMDIRLKREVGLRFTRYVDDLCFSSRCAEDVDNAIPLIHRIIVECGFAVAPEKCKRRDIRSGAVNVTGLSVNVPYFQMIRSEVRHHLSVRLSRKKIRAYRAMLHEACKGKRTQSQVEGTLGWVRQATRGFLPPSLRKPYQEYRQAVAEGRVPLMNAK